MHGSTLAVARSQSQDLVRVSKARIVTSDLGWREKWRFMRTERIESWSQHAAAIGRLQHV